MPPTSSSQPSATTSAASWRGSGSFGASSSPTSSQLPTTGHCSIRLLNGRLETSFPLFIDDDHLRGIFRVFDIDQSSEFDVFPLPVFADNLHEAASDVIGAAHREIRGRSRPRRRAIAALADVALHPKTAKCNRF